MLDNGKIDFNGLREICDDFESDSEFCQKNNVHISDDTLRAFLNAMDLDGNGVLDVDETVGILSARKEIGSCHGHVPHPVKA